jgi:biotin carboxyl carrier protein
MEVPITLREGERRWKFMARRDCGSPDADLEFFGADLPPLRILEERDGRVRFETDGVAAWAAYFMDSGRIYVDHAGRSAAFDDATWAPAAAARPGSDGLVRAPMSGKIVEVAVSTGQRVEIDQTLLILESMKMQNLVFAPVAGDVESISVAPGDQVQNRQPLLKLRPSVTLAATPE